MDTSPIALGPHILDPSLMDPNARGATRPRCECHGLVLDEQNDTLERHFTEQVKELGHSDGYKNVAAMLISWEGTDLENTDEEVDSLENILRSRYRFTVRKEKISTIGHASWSTLGFLVPFLSEHDSRNSLIILYYAGHGMHREADDQFEFSRTSYDDHRTSDNRIIWQTIESLLLEAHGDLLVIFDCCYSGALLYPKNRSQSRNIFSVIASTGAKQTAVGPGANSFTSALTYSLNQLADRKAGFAVFELLSEIEQAPYFKDTGQVIREGWRREPPRHQQLILRPLPDVQGAPSTPENVARFQQRESDEHLLRLDFAFSESPKESHVTDFVHEVADMIRKSRTPVKDVAWVVLGRRKNRFTFKDAARQFLEIARQRRLSSQTHSKHPPLPLSSGEYPHGSLESDSDPEFVTALASSPASIEPPSRKNSQPIHFRTAADEGLDIRFSLRENTAWSYPAPLTLSFRGRTTWSALIPIALLAFIAGICFVRGKDIWQSWMATT